MPIAIEMNRVYSKLRQNGLSHYIFRPRYLRSYGRYLINVLRRRWLKAHDAVYVLDMPLLHYPLDMDIPVRRIDSYELLATFAHEREHEDKDWPKGTYCEEVNRRFSSGDWCFCAIRDGKFVSAIFASRGPCYLDPVAYTLKIPDKTVGLYDVYTLGPYRGLHLYSAVFQSAINACLAEGYRAAWMWIMPDNYISFKTHAKLGMRHIFRRIECCRRWGLRRHLICALDLDVKALLGEKQPARACR